MKNFVRRRFVYNFIGDLLPGDGILVSKIRCVIARWAGCEVGKNVKIGQYVHLCGPGKIIIGDDAWIAAHVWIQSNGMVRIGNASEIMYQTLLTANGGSSLIVGNHCRVAHGVSIKTSTHEIDLMANCIGGSERYKDIVIGDGCWICAGAIITPGVRIGNRNVVAAGAVVLEQTPCEDGVLLAGVPATIKKRYYETN